MTQEMKNILTIFIIPIIVGVVLRLLFLKKSKGFIVTTGEGVLMLLMLLLSETVNTGGNEYLGIWFLMTSFAFIGSLVTEIAIIIFRKAKLKKSKETDFIPEK